MCITIPQHLPSKASIGEKRFWNILSSRLSDDFTLFYEPNVNNLEPDFILVGKNLGILVIEVKGWHCDQIERVGTTFFLIKQKTM